MTHVCMEGQIGLLASHGIGSRPSRRVRGIGRNGVSTSFLGPISPLCCSWSAILPSFTQRLPPFRYTPPGHSFHTSHPFRTPCVPLRHCRGGSGAVCPRGPLPARHARRRTTNLRGSLPGGLAGQAALGAGAAARAQVRGRRPLPSEYVWGALALLHGHRCGGDDAPLHLLP